MAETLRRFASNVNFVSGKLSGTASEMKLSSHITRMAARKKKKKTKKNLETISFEYCFPVIEIKKKPNQKEMASMW